MNMNTELNARRKRIRDAVELRTPDKVPFMPLVGNFYALGYNITIKDAMTDPLCVLPSVDEFASEYRPDLFYVPKFYSIPALESAGAVNMVWPEKTEGLGENTVFQYSDKSFIKDADDYDAFIRDPSEYLFRRVLPQKYTAFDGLKHLDAYRLCGPAPLSLAAAGIPALKESLLNLIHTAELTIDCLEKNAQLARRASQLGFPLMANSIIENPFDEFADSIRGLVDTVTDLYTDPELVDTAVTRWGEISIPAGIETARRIGAEFVMIPLHCGMDEFMSEQNYAKYYWPHLRKLIMAVIDAGMTPIVLTEGNYNTRLEQLCDIPSGKVIYSFEKVDMARAKKVLRGHACIAGNFPTASLISGTAEEVERYTRELIDTCAQDGGYIMSNSVCLDNADRALLRVWRETLDKYGAY
jgi:hypothetical protein